MAQPWRHPQTGVYHLRRQIPANLRPAFGGRALHKQTLGTKDDRLAGALFAQANAALEQQFAEAKSRLALTGDPRPSQRDRADELVAGYFEGLALADGALDGAERLLLARIELDHGLWNGMRFVNGAGQEAFGCSGHAALGADKWTSLAANAAAFRTFAGTVRGVTGKPFGQVWHDAIGGDHADGRTAQARRIAEQIRRHFGLDAADLPDGLADRILAYLDSLPVAAPRHRRPSSASSRLRSELRLMELFEAWRAENKPAEQSAHEARGATADLVDFLGDVPVAEIVNDDLLNYRDRAKLLPKAMPRADRLLPFTKRVARHEASDAERISAGTLKKRIGAIQALLTFAKQQRWIERNEGRDIAITGYQKAKRTRQTFQDNELKALFATDLFLEPAKWRFDRSVSDLTLYWLFLLGLTTGARLEEVGQAALVDLKQDGTTHYIDIDDYADAPEGDDKSVKTPNSRRLVPVHQHLIDLGLLAYADALRAAGHRQLFPDLKAGMFGKRTKEASRTANRFIDRHVSSDGRLVFHSLRHGFKDRAAEARIHDRVIDQICGHAPTTVGGRYGQGVRLPALARELHRIDWSFLDWDMLTRATSDLNWHEFVAALAAEPTRSESASGRAIGEASRLGRPQ